jgi:hypothetical protein
MDRYILGLAIVEGDRPARAILADYLEESGERGLAQWARKCGPTNRDRLEFGLMLLPCETSLALAAEFLKGARFPSWSRRRKFLAEYRAWKQEATGTEPFDSYRERMTGHLAWKTKHYGQPSIRSSAAHRAQWCANSFIEAMHCAHNFRGTQQREEGEATDGKSYHWQLQANQHVREVSKFIHLQMATTIQTHFDLVVAEFRRLADPAA